MTTRKDDEGGHSWQAGDWAWMTDKLGNVHKVYVHGVGIYGTFATISYSRRSRNTYQVRVRQLRRTEENHRSRRRGRPRRV